MSLLPVKTTASGRVTRRASSDPACFPILVRVWEDSRMTADKPGIRHQWRSFCRCLGESLDRSNSSPPAGATSCRRPPRGAFLIPRPMAVDLYSGYVSNSRTPPPVPDQVRSIAETSYRSGPKLLGASHACDHPSAPARSENCAPADPGGLMRLLLPPHRGRRPAGATGSPSSRSRSNSSSSNKSDRQARRRCHST